jgi:hypothetical protein
MSMIPSSWLTLEAIVVERPVPTEEEPQHLCLDKAYDNPTGEAAVAAHHYVPHIRRIGEEKVDAKGEKRYPARRWVVERTLAKVFANAGPFWCAMTRKHPITLPLSNSLACLSGIVGTFAYPF